MEGLLFRFKVNGRVVGSVLDDGEVRWDELEILKTFARQYLSVSARGGDPSIETAVGMDIDLISLPSGLRSEGQASVRIVFGVEERQWSPSSEQEVTT